MQDIITILKSNIHLSNIFIPGCGQPWKARLPEKKIINALTTRGDEIILGPRRETYILWYIIPIEREKKQYFILK